MTENQRRKTEISRFAFFMRAQCLLVVAGLMASCASGWKPSWPKLPRLPKREAGPLVYGEKYKAIHIPPLKNDSLQYGLEETLTASLIEHVMDDGRLKITRRENADLILEGAVTHAHQTPLAYDDDDRAIAYDLTIRVDMRLVEASGPDESDAAPPEPVLVAGPRTFTARGSTFLVAEPGPTRTRDLSANLADQIFSKFFEGW